MPKSEKTTVKTVTKAQKQKGLLLAVLAIPAGIVAWDVLWSFGFIAALVAFGISWAAIKLYVIGAGAEPDKDAAKVLLGIVVAGVVLSFVSGMAMDAQMVYSDTQHVSAIQAFTSADFWSFFAANLGYADVWGQYTTDILISLAFAVLGAYGTIRDLFMPKPVEIASK
jgi:hypothetical protein